MLSFVGVPKTMISRSHYILSPQMNNALTSRTLAPGNQIYKGTDLPKYLDDQERVGNGRGLGASTLLIFSVHLVS